MADPPEWLPDGKRAQEWRVTVAVVPSGSSRSVDDAVSSKEAVHFMHRVFPQNAVALLDQAREPFCLAFALDEVIPR